MPSKKPTAVTHIPLEPSTPPAPLRPPNMARQFSCLPPSLQDSAHKTSANEQMRIAESIEAATELCAQRREQHASFDIPCPDDSPYKGFVDGQTAFQEQKLRSWGSSSDDDSSDDGF